ncbi:hypothetical protein D3C78_1538610 [compost metagenome]
MIPNYSQALQLYRAIGLGDQGEGENRVVSAESTNILLLIVLSAEEFGILRKSNARAKAHHRAPVLVRVSYNAAPFESGAIDAN